NSLRAQSRLLHSQPGTGALVHAAVDPVVSIATLAAAVSFFGGRFDGACLILALLVFAMIFPGSFARETGSAGELMLDIVTGWLATISLLLLLGWASRTLGVVDQRMILAWRLCARARRRDHPHRAAAGLAAAHPQGARRAARHHRFDLLRSGHLRLRPDPGARRLDRRPAGGRGVRDALLWLQRPHQARKRLR